MVQQLACECQEQTVLKAERSSQQTMGGLSVTRRMKPIIRQKQQAHINT